MSIVSQPQVLSLLERTLREPAEKIGFNRIQVPIVINELTVQDIREIKLRALNALKYTIQANGKPPAGYDVTQILRIEGLDLPDDWEFTVNSTGEVELISVGIPSDTYLVIYGIEVLDTEEVISRLKIYKGSNVLADINLEEIYIDNSVPPVAFLTMPIPYEPNDTLRLVAIAKKTGSTKVVLRGYMATSAGKVLSSGS